MFPNLPLWLNILLTILAAPAGIVMMVWLLAAFYQVASNVIVPIIEESTGSKFGKPFKIVLSIIIFVIIIVLIFIFNKGNGRPVEV